MIPAANSYTVILDANVLFPQWKRDILLEFFEADLFRARWTERIQQEWLQNAIRRFPHLEDRLNRTDAVMRDVFDDAWVDGYEQFINVIDLPDPDDRHVVAAAIACKAHYIVTDNTRDFPKSELDRFSLEQGTADRFLAGTFALYRSPALRVLREHRQRLRSGPSPREYLLELRVKGMPLLSAQVQPFIDHL